MPITIVIPIIWKTRNVAMHQCHALLRPPLDRGICEHFGFDLRGLLGSWSVEHTYPGSGASMERFRLPGSAGCHFPILWGNKKALEPFIIVETVGGCRTKPRLQNMLERSAAPDWWFHPDKFISKGVFFGGGARFGARLTTFCGLVLPRGIYPYIPKWHRSCEKVASGKLTSLWNITMFNEKINYKSPCSIANC